MHDIRNVQMDAIRYVYTPEYSANAYQEYINDPTSRTTSSAFVLNGDSNFNKTITAIIQSGTPTTTTLNYKVSVVYEAVPIVINTDSSNFQYGRNYQTPDKITQFMAPLNHITYTKLEDGEHAHPVNEIVSVKEFKLGKQGLLQPFFGQPIGRP